MRKYAVEFIGTFFLTFVIGTAGLSHSMFVPLAAGGTAMAMVYAGGHISGAHYNPAVTVAALVRGRIGFGNAISYLSTQAVSGMIAGALARFVVAPKAVQPLTLAGHAEVAAIVVEALATFALAYVVLNVATSKDQSNNGFFGLAIGFVIVASAFAFGGISGGVFNPAVALGGVVAGLFAWSTTLTYVFVELVAGVAAGLAFLALNPGDR